MNASRTFRSVRALAILSVMLGIVAVPLSLSAGERIGLENLPIVAIPLVGAIILLHRPGNRIGRLMLGLGSVVVLSGFLSAYTHFAVAHDGWPAAEWAGWVSTWTYWGPLELYLVLLLLLFPTGGLLARWWAGVVVLIIGVTLTSAFIDILNPGRLEGFPDDYALENPLGVSGFEQTSEIVATLDLLLLVAILAAVASSVIRFRRSRGSERQQMTWFALVAVAIVALIIAMIAASELVEGTAGEYLELVFGVSFLLGIYTGLPIAIGVAILRYRLYEIDRVVNRALVYGLLSVALVGVYLLAVIGLGAGVQRITGESSQLVVATSTLAVAALFRPLRDRIQTIVNRRFNRTQYDAARTIEQFNARLRDEIDLDMLVGELQQLVHTTMQPAHLSVWLRTRGERA